MLFFHNINKTKEFIHNKKRYVIKYHIIELGYSRYRVLLSLYHQLHGLKMQYMYQQTE